MMERVEIAYVDGLVEVVEGDDISVRDGVLNIWNRHYNTSSCAPDVHAGSWPLTSIRHWRRLPPS